MLQALVLDWDILILVEKIVNFKLKLWQGNIFSTELILKFYQFVLKLNT